MDSDNRAFKTVINIISGAVTYISIVALLDDWKSWWHLITWIGNWVSSFLGLTSSGVFLNVLVGVLAGVIAAILGVLLRKSIKIADKSVDADVDSQASEHLQRSRETETKAQRHTTEKVGSFSIKKFIYDISTNAIGGLIVALVTIFLLKQNS